ncbi:MAG TPA: hypothetical protein VLN90_01345, partial [Thioalkalivibrio sp.]|nr:hypothetical protein [Thioalkalivibrio sp.]
MIQGNILAADALYEGGELLIGAEGRIICVGPSCSGLPAAQGATTLTCAHGVVSPGLINAHDHITWNQAYPASWGNERYDQRHDWRKGERGHIEIEATENKDSKVVAWNELRQVLSGTTSVVSSGGVEGFLRDLTDSSLEEAGLPPLSVDNNVFPLGDSGGTQLQTGCSYPEIVGTDVLDNDAFVPHVSEGVDQVAHNEYLCLSGQQSGGTNIISSKSAFVHSIALLVPDVRLLRQSVTSVIWSPRSNISLYGNTAQVTLYDNVGLNIALSTDWTPSGSMNL